jgi:hypothetical protein
MENCSIDPMQFSLPFKQAGEQESAWQDGSLGMPSSQRQDRKSKRVAAADFLDLFTIEQFS